MGNPGAPLTDVVHVLQQALTPVFLLSAIGALLILLTLCSIVAFVVEMLLAARGVRIAVAHTVGEPGGDGDPPAPKAPEAARDRA